MLKLCLRRAARPALLQLPPAPIARHSPGPSRRRMGTHGRNEPKEPLNSPKRAKEFIYRLQPNERTCLLRELQSFESIAIAQGENDPRGSKVTAAVLFHNALPFVGFGFLDNAIMIAAVKIKRSISVFFLCVRAAAALGNLVSDLAGLGLAGYVEALATKLGMQVPDMTPKQADMWQTRVSSHMGKAIGVTIGCILGMFPLFFLDDEKEAKPCRDTASQHSS
uniref:Transmembrane protein 65 n=1 Tax=Scophthalmus maximus TaxID=52904 RepID=A0A8D3C9U2_SCOMX